MINEQGLRYFISVSRGSDISYTVRRGSDVSVNRGSDVSYQ